MDLPYYKGAYRYSPDQWPRRRELEALREERELTASERDELSWLVFAYTNFLLETQRNR
jgi:hypothetical protein